MTKTLDPGAAVLRKLYAHYDTVFPHLLSEEERKRVKRSRDIELGYGITPPRVLQKIFALAKATPRDVFYDLGCGVGHTVVVASYFCKKAKGVEVLPGLADAARGAAAAMGRKNVQVTSSDVSKVDLSDGTFFYTYSTFFKPPLLKAIAEAVAQAKPGSRIITVTSELKHPRLELVQSKEIDWDDAEQRAKRLKSKAKKKPEKNTRLVHLHVVKKPERVAAKKAAAKKAPAARRRASR